MKKIFVILGSAFVLLTSISYNSFSTSDNTEVQTLVNKIYPGA
ncbi:hypothetical protein [Bacillus sp. EAC]|nr:hypothetical protein [Bacillus sp. EAC]